MILTTSKTEIEKLEKENAKITKDFTEKLDKMALAPVSGESLLDLSYATITKTCLCNIYRLDPQIYIAKLWYAGIFLFFLFLLQK